MAMSVNLSMRQLESTALVDHVTDALAAAQLDPAQLTLEVTESSLMRDAQATVTRLRRLKELGVMIAIDDFGTGYSSLAYLRQFPVDVLKIDGSFVAEMDGSPDAAALVHTLVELGRILGLVTLAEGIENPIQLEGVRAELCDRGQGFVISPPLSAAEFRELLQRPSPCSRPGRWRRPDPDPAQGPDLGEAFFRRWPSRITSRSTSAPSTAAIRSTQIRLIRVLKKTNPTLTV